MYQMVQPPFSLNFREMGKKELKEYYQWFMSNIPIRLNELKQVLALTPGFEGWQTDFSPESLTGLGEWFAIHVEVRKKTKEEIDKIKSQLTFPIDIPEEELTEATFSLAYDIGIYLSQVFLKNHGLLKWEQLFGNKKNVDYGQPVLMGFGKVPFNPIRITVVLAYGLSDKTRNGNGLKEIYDIWQNNIASVDTVSDSITPQT